MKRRPPEGGAGGGVAGRGLAETAVDFSGVFATAVLAATELATAAFAGCGAPAVGGDTNFVCAATFAAPGIPAAGGVFAGAFAGWAFDSLHFSRSSSSSLPL